MSTEESDKIAVRINPVYWSLEFEGEHKASGHWAFGKTADEAEALLRNWYAKLNGKTFGARISAKRRSDTIYGMMPADSARQIEEILRSITPDSLDTAGAG